MATEADLPDEQDNKVIVLLHPNCSVTTDDLLALLSASGIDPAPVTIVEPADVGECGDIDCTPVIIPLDDGICNDPELETVARQCGAAGGRVTVLFSPDCTFQGLHPIADKYGTQCDWSAVRLKTCISGDVEIPHDATATPTAWSEASEVKCGRKR